jgi:hypothetical protein
MLNDIKIIMMDCDCPSIYFPIGPPSEGGTCAFATEKCMQYCPSGMVANDIERHALQFFFDNTASEIINRLHREFREVLKNPRAERMLQWWTWGDCLPELTDKIAEVIVGLHRKGIPQYGFTRNKKLWRKIPNHDSLHIGLTVDDMDEALKLSIESGKMTACPDFDAGYAQMIFTGKVRSRCSGWWCITERGETRNSDCTQCLAAGEGCYYRV